MKPNDQGREARQEAYRYALRDPRWRIRRQEILEARSRRCEGCGSAEKLHVHHGYYLAGRMPWDYPDSALHVLCADCHEDEHSDEPTESLAPAVRSIAAALAMPKPARDVRPKLWEIAQSRSSSKADAAALMKVVCWLWFERGIHDLAIMNQVASTIVGMTNPYAYLQPGGVALESLIGARAVERAEADQEQHTAADRAAGLTRRKP